MGCIRLGSGCRVNFFLVLVALFMQMGSADVFAKNWALPSFDDSVLVANQISTVKFNIDDSADSVPFSVYDSNSLVVQRSVLNRVKGLAYSANLQLPKGFYQIEIQGRRRGFIAVDKNEVADFFGLDAALSVLVPNSGNAREHYLPTRQTSCRLDRI